MEYNAYDFDKTIYKKDSTAGFYFFCLRRNPVILIEVPVTATYLFLYLCRFCSKTVFKEKMYRFLRHLDAVDELVSDYWNASVGGIADFYKAKHQSNDIIISASPEFLLRPVCKMLDVKNLIASRVDAHTGLYTGLNCHGEEKVRRLREEMPDVVINEFYSDSLSDTPMAKIAATAYLVKKNKIVLWP